MNFRQRGLRITKGIAMALYCVVVFLLFVIFFGSLMNSANPDMTLVMSEASFPVLNFKWENYDINRVYGYANQMDESLLRDAITPLMPGRKISFRLETFDEKVSSIAYELRTTNGERLIENAEIFNYITSTDAVTGDITLKDLIYKDTEYTLCIIVETDAGQQIRYYTKIIDLDDINLGDKLKFAYDFSNTTFDKIKAQTELTTYIESNSSGDNSTFNHVNIHSSLNQITWGNLNISKVTEPVASVKDFTKAGAVIGLEYFVETKEGDKEKYYRVEEEYSLRQGSERIFLMSYDRYMEEIFNKDTQEMANNKIVLGITSKDVHMAESPDGNRLAFVNDGRLYTYNLTDNKLAYVFGFYETETDDVRYTNNHHDIKIFNVDETGNVYFMVYGYMNRGIHEGQMGAAVYFYDSTVNTVEEQLYIQTDQSYDILKGNVQNLAYVNGQSQCFLLYGGDLYKINLETGSESVIAKNLNFENYVVNNTGSIICYLESDGEKYHDHLSVYNMEKNTYNEILVDEDSVVRPIGFFGDDVIYGQIRNGDIVEDVSGRTLLPMYKILIRNKSTLLKEYDEGNYIMDWELDDNMLNLIRTDKVNSDGSYTEIESDQILNNITEKAMKNSVETVVIDKYETIVQLVLKKEINSKTLQILTPKQVILEKNKEVDIRSEDLEDYYYVFVMGQYYKTYMDVADAVRDAYSMSGVVTDSSGYIVYKKKDRISKNQIMAITATELESDDSLSDSQAVCINVMLEYNGIVYDSRNDVRSGINADAILSENLPDYEVLYLRGCPLDVLLNYVEKDIPVLAYTSKDKAVLIVGYNEYNTVLMDPETGTVYKYGINDSTEMFEKAGNRFITYMKYVD